MPIDVITGAPHSGKTTLIDELERRGYPVIREAGTRVITRLQERGVDPFEDIYELRREILRTQKELESLPRTGFWKWACQRTNSTH